jgi:hypothetical protein
VVPGRAGWQDWQDWQDAPLVGGRERVVSFMQEREWSDLRSKSQICEDRIGGHPCRVVVVSGAARRERKG